MYQLKRMLAKRGDPVAEFPAPPRLVRPGWPDPSVPLASTVHPTWDVDTLGD